MNTPNTLRACGSCAFLHYAVTRARAVAMAHESGRRPDEFERCVNCGASYRDFVSVPRDYLPATRLGIASPIIFECAP